MARIPVVKKRLDISGTCPFCGSDEISETGYRFFVDELEIDCFCVQCHSKFNEVYDVKYNHTEWIKSPEEDDDDDRFVGDPEVKDPIINSEED